MIKLFFSDHLFLTFLFMGTALFTILLGALTAQLIDADHSGDPDTLLSCAVHNDTEHCPPLELVRGYFHHTRPFLAVVYLTFFMIGVSSGYYIHLRLDSIL